MDGKNSSGIRSFFATLACGFTGVLLSGLLFSGHSIFLWGKPSAFVLTAGFTCALIFSALKYRSIHDSVLFVLLALLIDIVLIKAMPLSFIIRDAVLFTGLWFSMFVYWRLLKNLADKYVFLRALACTAITPAALCASALILIIINSGQAGSTGLLNILYFYFKIGAVAGFGLGLGFDAAEIILNGIKKKQFVKTN